MLNNFFLNTFFSGFVSAISFTSYAATIGPGTINSTVNISDGSSSTIVSDTTINTTLSNTIATYVTNGTLILGGTNILIQSGFYGILVEPGAAGSLQSAPGSSVTIRTTGGRSESYGIAAKYSRSSLFLDTIDIGTTGNGAAGIILDSGATCVATNLIISTTGTKDPANNNAASYGISVQYGSKINVTNSIMSTYGVSSSVLFNHSAQLIGSNLQLNSYNTNGYGSATQIGSTELTHVIINTAGQGGIGSFVVGNASGNSSFKGSYNQTTTTGANAYGFLSADYSTSQLTYYQVLTSGNEGYGLYVSGPNSNLQVSTTNVRTRGGSAFGGISYNGGSLFLEDNHIVTEGNAAYGVVVYSNVNTLFPTNASVSNSTITTSGSTAHGLAIIQGGNLTVSGSIARVTGADASALFIRSDAGATGTAVINGGSLYSSGTGIDVLAGVANISLNNTKIQGENLWLHLGDSRGRSALPVIAPLPVGDDEPGNISSLHAFPSKEQKAFVAVNSTATIVSNNSILIGAAITEINNTSNVTLNNRTFWDMTGSSNLTYLINNDSTIHFSSPSSGYKSLMVNDYHGESGMIHLNTYLDKDSSPSDLLVIEGGSATGTTALKITNAQSAGAATVANGILVVEAINGATTDNKAFSLNGRAVAGPYEYSLFRSSVDDSGLENWYLRSTIDCSDGVISEQCPFPLTPDEPNYREEVSLYSTVTSMASKYGRTLLSTLDERVGMQKNLLPIGPQGIKPSAIWGRVFGAHGLNKGGRYGIYTKEGARFDYDMGGFQTGIDLYRVEHKDHVGVYGAAGQINGNAQKINHIKAGSSKTNAYTLGAYWTHYGTSGWYLDGIAQATRYETSQASVHAMRSDANGSGFAGSLEGGSYPFLLANRWMLVPQAQLVYQNISLGRSYDSAATVWFHSTDYVSGRIGARLSKDFNFTLPKKQSVTDMTAWLRPSLWREFKGNAITSFSSANGLVPFASNLGGNWVEITGGLTAKVKEHIKFYASGSYDIGVNNSYAYNGSLGVNVVW